MAARMRDFSRVLSELHVIVRNSDWFMAPFAPVVIGRNKYFGISQFDIHVKSNLWGRCRCLRPSVRSSKDPKTLRARKAIRKTTTRLFCKADLFICR